MNTLDSEVLDRVKKLQLERDSLIVELNLSNEYQSQSLTQEEKNTRDIAKISRVLEINNTLKMLENIVNKRKERKE